MLSKNAYLTLARAFDSQTLAAVPTLAPLMSTAINFPRWAEVTLNVLRVAPEIFLHVDGTEVRAAAIALEHEYHWYVNVGAGYPVHVPLTAAIVLPTLSVPCTEGLTTAVARSGTI